MDPISRRMFLGTVSAVTAETVVIAATPKEIAAFGVQKQMPIEAYHPYIPSAISDLHIGELVFNAKGEVLGVIENAEIEITRDIIDVSTYNNYGPLHTAGPQKRTVRYSVIGYGEATMEVRCRPHL